MNYKQFISSVSAFAIAATTFAAMAATASAKSYTDVTPTSGKTSNVTAKGSGVYTLSGTPGGVVVDFSDLEDINDATSVTVDFDTKLVGSSSAIAQLMFGVGDKTVRGLTCGGSSNSGYNRSTGLVTFFGSTDGTHYYINQKGTTDYAAAAKNKIVHATVTLNRETGAWTADYSVNGVTVNTSGTTTVDNITVVEAFAWNVTQAYDITLANVKVSYTVPDAPAPATYSFDLTNADSVTGTDGNAVVIKNTVTGITEINTITVEAGAQTKEFTNGADFEFGTISGDAEIGIVVKGVSSVDSITIN